MRKNTKGFIVFIFLILALGFLIDNGVSFFYGAVVSWANIALHYGVFNVQKKRLSRYQSQALVVMVSSTVTRFFIMGSLLALGFRNSYLEAVPLLLGFVLGQLFFLIHQLLVVTDNGK